MTRVQIIDQILQFSFKNSEKQKKTRTEGTSKNLVEWSPWASLELSVKGIQILIVISKMKNILSLKLPLKSEEREKI